MTRHTTPTPTLRLWLILGLVALLDADSNFVEPVEEFLGVEYYEFEGDRYAIYTQLVTWEEAHQLCPSRNGTLIDYETPGLAEFIARALAESAVGFGALWINGKHVRKDRTVETGEWKWMKSGTPIDVSAADGTKYPMETAPFWVDKAPTGSLIDLCLGTDRRLHHLPLIVPVDCKQRRPYICKLAAKNDGGVTEVKPPVSTKDKLFHIFQAQVTWSEALAECQIMGFKLAKVTKAEDFKKIGHKMLRVRPVMENAWIGGSFADSKWTWVSSDEAINVDKANSTDVEPFAWYRPDNIVPEGCLLADRHVCDHFVYVEAKCDRRRPFICEHEVSAEVVTPFEEIGEGIWISQFIETWHRAQLTCKECFGGTLVQIKASKEEVEKYLPIFYKAMALSKAGEIRHVWIGGYLFEDKFKWTDSKDNDPKEDTLVLDSAKYISLYGNGEKGILEYCNVSLELETYLKQYKCLNMDRENQKNFFMYGLNCDLKQHFICKAGEGVKAMKDCEAGRRQAKKSTVTEDYESEKRNLPSPTAPAPAPASPEGA